MIFKFMKPETSWLFFILELNLVRAVKCNEKGFYRYISSKRKTIENTSLLMNGAEALSMEKAEVLNASFASVFTNKDSPQKSPPETRE